MIYAWDNGGQYSDHEIVFIRSEIERSELEKFLHEISTSEYDEEIGRKFVIIAIVESMCGGIEPTTIGGMYFMNGLRTFFDEPKNKEMAKYRRDELAADPCDFFLKLTSSIAKEIIDTFEVTDAETGFHLECFKKECAERGLL